MQFCCRFDYVPSQNRKPIGPLPPRTYSMTLPKDTHSASKGTNGQRSWSRDFELREPVIVHSAWSYHMGRNRILPRRAMYQRMPGAGIQVTESQDDSNQCNGQPFPENDTSITSLGTDVNPLSELPVTVAPINEGQNEERGADILPLIPEDDTTQVLVWSSQDYMRPSTNRKHLITRKELKQLRYNKYLNDILIEFGLALELSRLRNTNPEVHHNTLLFTTFFFSKLHQDRQSTQNRNQPKPDSELNNDVHRWTKHINIFEKKYLIIPINEEQHWYFLVVLNPRQLIDHTHAQQFLLLSIDSNNQPHISQGQIVIQYLIREAQLKLNVEISAEAVEKLRIHQVTVPQQHNWIDCGPYTIHYCKTFLSDPERISNWISNSSKIEGKEIPASEIWDSSAAMQARYTLERDLISMIEKDGILKKK